MDRAGTIVSSRTGESQWLVELAGEHDLSTAAALREALEKLLAGGASVVVDMSHVTFIDSSVVGVLVGAHLAAARLDGQRVDFVAPVDGTPARLLDLVGARNVLHVFDSRTEAIRPSGEAGAPS